MYLPRYATITLFYLLSIQLIKAAKLTTENETPKPILFPLNDSRLLPESIQNQTVNSNDKIITNNATTSDMRKARRVAPGFDPSKLLKGKVNGEENKTNTKDDMVNNTIQSDINNSTIVENLSSAINDPVQLDNNETRNIDLLQDLKIELIVSRGSVEEPLVEGEIFRDGKLSKFFRTCATEEEALNSELIYPLSKRECFRDSEYTDRIEFRFYYDSSLLSEGRSVVSIAQINHLEDTVASSYISNEKVRTLTESEPSGTVQIYYGCMENATETLSLLFTVKNSTSEEIVKMTWEKYCQTGMPRHIQMKSLSNSKETIFWPPEEAMDDIAMAPSQMSTSLDISLDRKYLQQYFIGPYINQSDTSVVKATLRGTESKGGILHSDSSVHFNIMYACKGTGVSEISFTMAVPPFSNVTAVWMKGT